MSDGEYHRLKYLTNVHGEVAARDFAGRTYRIYRKAVLNPRHFASKREYRRKFIDAYVVLKRFSSGLITLEDLNENSSRFNV